jgi:hypothetical protein
MENTEQSLRAITPSLARWPEPQQAPEPGAQPIAEPTEVEKLTAENAKLREQLDELLTKRQFRKDQKQLDLELRIRSLRDFLQQRRSWEKFLDKHAWW